MKYKSIGILGGMGPEATAELYSRIIKLFQKELQAKFDKDFPEIFIYNLPLPDVVCSTVENKRVLDCLVESAVKLEEIGADFIVMPCNTIEYFLPDIRNKLRIEVISIVETVRKYLQNKNIDEVLLLSTEATAKWKIYDKELQKSKIKMKNVNIQIQGEVTRIIMNILSGQKLKKDKRYLQNLLKNIESDCVILGCTELPLLINQRDSKIKLVDTLDLLAETAFMKSVG
jgi:aspartate racemase